jgi:hypothetical protein
MYDRVIARQTNRTLGEVVSELARRSLQPPATRSERNGIPLIPQREAELIITADLVNALRDEAH